MTKVHDRTVITHHNGGVHAVERPQSGGPSETHLGLARWLLAHEMNDAKKTLAVSEAAEQACQKLLERLARLITPNGCRALLSRALLRMRWPAGLRSNHQSNSAGDMASPYDSCISARNSSRPAGSTITWRRCRAPR